MGANANDIVNLNVDATFNGATITNDLGQGGEALAGWAIDVMMGDDEVEDVLDDAGMGAFESTLTFADLPVTYTVSLAEDQDDALDGGEMYDGCRPDLRAHGSGAGRPNRHRHG